MLQVKLPLEVGSFMECEWKQGQYHRAKIIERRKRSDAPDYEYYVHYIGCELYTLCHLYYLWFCKWWASRPASNLDMLSSTGMWVLLSVVIIHYTQHRERRYGVMLSMSASVDLCSCRGHCRNLISLLTAVNRRMDEWTTLDHVDLTTVTTSEAELAAAVTESGGRTRNQKRKADEVHEEEEHHAEFDQNALREHEEFTKVKNVERIELGRYEMETWYFSPLPQEYNMCKVCITLRLEILFHRI